MRMLKLNDVTNSAGMALMDGESIWKYTSGQGILKSEELCTSFGKSSQLQQRKMYKK